MGSWKTSTGETEKEQRERRDWEKNGCMEAMREMSWLTVSNALEAKWDKDWKQFIDLEMWRSLITFSRGKVEV